MTLPFIRSLSVLIAAAGVYAMSPGCASTPDAEDTVNSMSSFGIEVARIKDSIDGAVQALDAVAGTQPGDIERTYEDYTESVKALDGQAAVVRDLANEMKARGDEFFKEWEAPEKVSAERRSELTGSYAIMKESMILAKEDFTPFLSSLRDIQSYLSLDLSLQGVEATSSLVKKAKEDGALVKARIDTVLTQLNSVRGMLSTTKS